MFSQAPSWVGTPRLGNAQFGHEGGSVGGRDSPISLLPDAALPQALFAGGSRSIARKFNRMRSLLLFRAVLTTFPWRQTARDNQMWCGTGSAFRPLCDSLPSFSFPGPG